MNPRYRRLLIPGLLLALLAIVVIASLAGKADAAEVPAQPDGTLVSRLADGRINESSGLVVSPDDPDRAYTINDSGGAPIVYAVSISTGATLGTATVGGDFVDTEALSIDGDGTLWVADTGDNRAVRTDAALYALPQIADGTTSVPARRYPITYPGGPLDVEALVISPVTGEKFLISKGLFGGTVFALPGDLTEDGPNEAVALAGDIPGLVTDAAFTPDGRYVVARDYSEAYVLDPVTWQIVSSTELPELDQGETLAMEASGRSYLVGSEGTGSPLVRVPFTPPVVDDEPSPATPSATPSATAGSGIEVAPNGNGFAGATWFWGFVVVALLAAISAAATTTRK